MPGRPPDPGGHDLSPDEFEALYGEWRGLLPAEVARLFEFAPFPWWIAGGWAIEAASGVSRPHEDTDVVVLRRDLAALRDWLSDYHLWETHGGALRPLRPGGDLEPDREQLWVRRNARSPWLLDLLLTPTDEEWWLYKRDESVRLPLGEVGRTGPDGVPYLRPEIVLLFKAKLYRPKDNEDLRAMQSKLGPRELRWLLDALTNTLPGHPWLAEIVRW